MRDLDLMLQGFREELADQEVGQLEKTLLQARAIAALEEAITPAMMVDMMKLMNSPLGFKTDKKPPGELYHESTVKRCLIVAMLYGAKVTGNEFNIIASNCYLTKEFTRPAILRWKGLRRFEITIGAPMKHGEKTSACDAIATWELDGEIHELRCVKTPEMDARVVVNSHATSSPDEIRGKVEAKLFQRVLGRLTGLNIEAAFGPQVDDPVDALTFEATKNITVSESAVEEEPSAITDEEAANLIVGHAVKDFGEIPSVNGVQKACHDRVQIVRNSEWSEELLLATVKRLDDAAVERINAIRSSRGK